MKVRDGIEAGTSMPDGFVAWYRGLEKRKLLSERCAKRPAQRLCVYPAPRRHSILMGTQGWLPAREKPEGWQGGQAGPEGQQDPHTFRVGE